MADEKNTPAETQSDTPGETQEEQANAQTAQAQTARTETAAPEEKAAPAGMEALAALKDAPAGDAPQGEAAGKGAGMEALGALKDAPAAPPAEPQIDNLGRSYATGRRKDAAARVWVKRGSGRISVNGKDVKEYFARPVLQMLIDQPFDTAGRKDEFDVVATVRGGGLSGQAGAVRHGISHALIRFEPALRPALKAGGFLTRDSRVVERKKYGRRKARRSFQFSKR